ncbi:hypothetical protein [Serratia proteamaculans]
MIAPERGVAGLINGTNHASIMFSFRDVRDGNLRRCSLSHPPPGVDVGEDWQLQGIAASASVDFRFGAFGNAVQRQ